MYIHGNVIKIFGALFSPNQKFSLIKFIHVGIFEAAYLHFYEIDARTEKFAIGKVHISLINHFVCRIPNN